MLPWSVVIYLIVTSRTPASGDKAACQAATAITTRPDQKTTPNRLAGHRILCCFVKSYFVRPTSPNTVCLSQASAPVVQLCSKFAPIFTMAPPLPEGRFAGIEVARLDQCSNPKPG
jgi:hypothetical protein